MPTAIKGVFSSWRTTTGGIGAISAGIAMLMNAIGGDVIDAEGIATGIGLIVAGIGMLFARDNAVTSEAADAK